MTEFQLDLDFVKLHPSHPGSIYDCPQPHKWNQSHNGKTIPHKKQSTSKSIGGEGGMTFNDKYVQCTYKAHMLLPALCS
jgi:hypothetical protein